MAKKKRFTLAQHDELGKELQVMMNRLSNITATIHEAYPARVSGVASEAAKTLNDLRSALDAEVCRENPDIGNDAGCVYYRPTSTI